jgi:hypothetical protein
MCLLITQQAIAAPDGLGKLPSYSTSSNAGYKETYNAMEAESLRISLDASNNGFIEGKVCDACEKIKVIITPSTKAYIGKREVPLKQAKDRLGRYATVIFDIETKNASVIRW